MRNLKRALSLTLAAAMLISLMVVGASAAEYKDQVSVSKDEAVAVLTGLGVVGGDQNGNFNPTATLTRAEYCVMIANALTGGTFDRTLFDGTDTPFTDVQGHWGAAYIAYCYSTGIIAGTSATTFSPDATLTAAQAAAILLMALGYNQNNEFGANGQFELNVTKWAQQAGLYTNLSVAANSGISRENAAQVIFNALTVATPVGYNTLSEAYYTIGTPALNGEVIIIDDSNRGTGDWQKTLGYTNFDLSMDSAGAAGTDHFARPGYTCVYDKEDIYFATNAPVVTYTDEASASAVSRALNGYTYAASLKDTTDGAEGSAVAASATIAGLTGPGVLVEVYDRDADKEIDAVIVINEYLGRVARVAENDAGETEATVNGMTYKTTNFERGDRVIYTMAEVDGSNEIQSMVPAESVQGTVTALSSDYLRIDGTAYDFNDAYSNSLGINDTCLVYLDTYGNIIGTGDVESEGSNYAYVTAIDSNLGELEARLVLADGTSVRVDVDDEDGDGNDIITNTNPLTLTINNGDFVSYELNDDVYVLTKLTDGTDYTALSGATINKDKAAIATGVVASTSTIYVDVDGNRVYTGYGNVPSMSGVDGAAIIKNGVATYVFITDGTKTGDADSTYIFVADNTKYETVELGNTEYALFTVYVDGEAQEMYIRESVRSATIDAPGVYKVDTINDNGYVTALTATEDVSDITAYAAVASNGVLSIGEGKTGSVGIPNIKTYTYNDDTVFVVADTNNSGKVTNVYVGDVTDITLYDMDANKTAPENADASNVCVVTVDSENAELATLVFIIN